MQVKLFSLLLAAVVVVWASPAWAGRCLDIEETRIVWCDDYDNYCEGGASWPGYPPFPAGCATDGSAVPDDAAYVGNWPISPDCGTWGDNHALDATSSDPDRILNLPFSLQFKGGYPGDPEPTGLASNRHVFSLLPAIQAQDETKNAVNGTDIHPLKLKYYLHHYTNADCEWCNGDTGNAIWYAELTMDNDRAPTDYVWHHCDPGSESFASYPVVVQQRQNVNIHVPHPPLSTTIHSSIAVGLMALLDTYPCDVENGRRPTNYHLSVFDGLKWWDLRSNVFPGIGDFGVGTGGGAWVYMEVRSNQFYVEWDVALEHNEATIPRQYLGAFNRIASGPGPGCELDADPESETYGQCLTSPDCFKYCGEADDKAKWCWRHTWVDSPVLYDGVLVTSNGACCMENGDCDDLSEADCRTAGGEFLGSGTLCEGMLCCPLPFADKDVDGDVDQMDFGAFQVCYTGNVAGVPVGCECFDRDRNSRVDANDFTQFTQCWTGANVPYKTYPPLNCAP